MKQFARFARYAGRFLVDKKYRTRIIDLLGRQSAGASASSVRPADDEFEGAAFLRGRRLFVAGGCEVTFLTEYLELAGMVTAHSFSEGRPSDPLSELMTPGSKALSESWDYYLFSVSQILRRPIAKLQIEGLRYTRDEQEADLSDVLANYERAISVIRERSEAPIFLNSYVLGYRPTFGFHEYRSLKEGMSLVELMLRYHTRLYELARRFPAVYVLDSDLAMSESGKEAAIDPATSSGIYDHPNRVGAKLLGQWFVKQLRILEPGQRRIKCAVFDLDGTLWTGILREDGPGGVTVHEYQLDIIEQLAARGILLALCSKNDEIEEQHLPSLLGPRLYEKIVAKRLSWRPKSEALRDIAEELNIGLDTLAFFDDSDFERAEVKANAPEVLVLSPDELFSAMNRVEFQPAGEVTADAASRTAKYREQSKRKDAERHHPTGLDDFLRTCELRLSLARPTAGELSRVFELLQRTNQLNATLTRTSMETLKRYFEKPEQYALRIARLEDKFGSYGLVGFAAAEKLPGEWRIIELALSCRGAGRGVEKAMLNDLGLMARDAGVPRQVIDFHKGLRNQQMYQLLQETGLLPLGDPETSSVVSMARTASSTSDLAYPDWLAVTTDRGRPVTSDQPTVVS